MLLKKRQILSATLVIALVAALSVNWYFSDANQANLQSENNVSEEAVTGSLGDTLFVGGTTVAQTVEESTDEESDTSAEDYFASAKLKRQNAYDEVIENIEKFLDEDDITSEVANTVTVLISDYQSDMKLQSDTENIISAKTGSDCLVVINGENCEVILEKNTLSDSAALQITEIIQKNTNISAENLTIIELK